MKKIYIIAGEPSGDFIGAKLLNKLKNKDIVFKFIGGNLMEQEMASTGVKSLFPISKIAIMGLVEVLIKIFSLKKLINNTIEDIKNFNPDVIITIDSLGFNGRIIAQLKKQRDLNKGFKNTKFVHYVAPSVWAWKPGRALKLSKIYDYLLCLFDFEIPFFEKHGLKTYFVGHPIVESGANLGNKEDLIKKYNLDTNKKYIVLMPGSRLSEVSRLLPVFIKSYNLLKEKYQNLEIIIPTLPHLKKFIEETLKNYKQKALIVTSQQDKYDSFNIAKLAIVASGTATLELSIANVPSIVAYKVNYITSKIAALLIKVKYASIINIIAKKEIIKEFIQEKCTVNNITKASINVLENTNNQLQQEDKVKVLNILYNLGYNSYTPSEKAAKIIENILN